MLITSKGQPTKYRNLISQRVNQLSPSGIRKFFDLLASMEEVISLGLVSLTSSPRGISVRRLSPHWRKAIPCIPQIQGCLSYVRNYHDT